MGDMARLHCQNSSSQINHYIVPIQATGLTIMGSHFQWNYKNGVAHFLICGVRQFFIRIKINNRKRDSEDHQSFVSEDFYFGFWFWTKFLAVLGFLSIFCAVFRFLIGLYAPLFSVSLVNHLNTKCDVRL